MDNILIIEKESLKQVLLKEIIQHLGYSPYIVTNVKKAIVIAHKRNFSHAFISDDLDDYCPNIVSHILKKKGIQIIINQHKGFYIHCSYPFDYILDWITIQGIKNILTTSGIAIEQKRIKSSIGNYY